MTKGAPATMTQEPHYEQYGPRDPNWPVEPTYQPPANTPYYSHPYYSHVPPSQTRQRLETARLVLIIIFAAVLVTCLVTALLLGRGMG